MLSVRRIVVLCTLLLTVIAWGCSSEDDEEGQPAAALVASDFQLTSANFTEIRPKVRIPVENTCYGENTSPPLMWEGAPEGTQSFALAAEDLDYDPGTWVHWVLYNIPPTVRELAEGIMTSTAELPDGTLQGTNDFKNVGYQGPCPLPTPITGWHIGPAHRYVFTLYALDTKVSLPPGANREQLMGEIDGHILAQTETIGKFQVTRTRTGKQELGQSIYAGPTSDSGPSTVKPIYNTRGDLIAPTPTGQ